MVTRTRTLLQAAVIGCALAVGSVGMTAVVAQDTPNTATEEDDGGFNDWGLLGLLGLAGLAGLRKRPEPAVRVTDRSTGTQR